MYVIVCNIQMFSNDQMVYVINTDNNQEVFVQKISLNALPDVVCALANQYGATEVKLHGDVGFNGLWAEEIKSTYALNHNFTTLNVEVL